MPQNLKLLSDRLPKPKYGEDIIGGALAEHKDVSASLLIPSDTGKHILVQDNVAISSTRTKNHYNTSAAA